MGDVEAVVADVLPALADGLEKGVGGAAVGARCGEYAVGGVVVEVYCCVHGIVVFVG